MNSNNHNAQVHTKLQVELPTEGYYEDEVECRSGCPVKTDCRGYLLATVDGDTKKAYAISRATNPFASICGKICGAPCEKKCRRKDTDHTLSIRNMKGYLTSNHGPETGDLKTPLTYAKVPGSVNPTPNGNTVGIIGGGVAGYAAAHDLARLGYQCTIYERHKVSGGQLVQGVPVNRLDRDVVQAEIDSILQLGLIDVVHNCDVGKDKSFAEIKKSHDAVFIGVGLSVGRILPMDNADNEAVHSGLKFLLDFNFGNGWDLKDKRAIVIGGGDVAMDVARSALRCQSPTVNLACLERDHLGEMPGSKDERDGGRREGVVFNDGWGPDEIVVENGKLKGLRVKKVESVFDADGRFSPTFDESQKRLIEGDILFMAVGQTSDLSFLDGSGVEAERGIIKVDPKTNATNVEGVFAGGDISLGPKLFIDAIQAGSIAALGIDSYLQQKPRLEKKRQIFWEDLDDYRRDSRYVDQEFVDREELAVDPAKEPTKNSTVEYSDEEAYKQSLRCLGCHIHPTFEGNICILCGGCVDVCPSYCLRMVHVSRLSGDDCVVKVLNGEFGTKVNEQTDGSAMLFDPLKCIRCGMCSRKCPTGACKMSVNTFNDTFLKTTQTVVFANENP